MFLPNDTEQKVLRFIRDNDLIRPNTSVCVCFSGGIDSTCLLYMLHRLSNVLKIRLSACHLNHGIRGKDADDDETFCIRVCASLGIPLFTRFSDIPSLQVGSGYSTEEVSRRERYRFYEELAQTEGINTFATAHHMNDQAETVLYRIARGTTVAGLSGIPVKRDAYIRPFLCLNRKEIRSYLDANDLKFCVDRTNASEEYARNRIRLRVIPELEEINSNALDSFRYLSECALEDQSFLVSLLPAYTEKQFVGELPNALLRRIIMRNYMLCTGNTLCRTHLHMIMDLVLQHKNGKICISDGVYALIRDGFLSFEIVANARTFYCSDGELIDGCTDLFGGAIRITLGDADCENPNQFVYNLSTEILLSKAHICGKIKYRARAEGDRIRSLGIDRLLKKTVSEKKIPAELRKALPVFYDDQGILCMPFVAISDRIFTKNSSESIRLRLDVATDMFM